jgi:hypothetical protein
MVSHGVGKKQNYIDQTFACTRSQTSTPYSGVVRHFQVSKDLLDWGELCAMVVLPQLGYKLAN